MKIGDVPKYVKGVGKNATTAANRSVKTTRKAIRERPLTAVGAAVVGGTLIGLVAGTVAMQRKDGEKPPAAELEEVDLE